MDEALRLIAIGLKKAEKQEDGTFKAKITEDELEKQGIKDTMSLLSWRVCSPAKDGSFCNHFRDTVRALFSVSSSGKDWSARNIVSTIKREDGILQIVFSNTATDVIDAAQGKAVPAEDWYLKYMRTRYTAEYFLQATADI